jgi:electron transfer flavoprotein alpha subunit
LAKQAFDYGADQVWLADHALLDHFTIDAYAQVTYKTLIKEKPSIFLAPATPNGRDLAGRLAVRMRTGLNADCTNLWIRKESGVLVCEVSGFGGGVLALIEMEEHRPQMATVRPGVFTAEQIIKDRIGEIKHCDVVLNEKMISTRINERILGEGFDLTQAEVLVVGGRGIDGHYEMIEELAKLVGGEVGATRPPVDEGHIERDRMIGQTGTVCRPKLVITCGVSGAFHFVVGIQDADTVIAINTDPAAPIFDYADYCIVGDVFQIVPELIAALRSMPEVRYA